MRWGIYSSPNIGGIGPKSFPFFACPCEGSIIDIITNISNIINHHKELASSLYEFNFENVKQSNQMQPCVCH